MSDGAGDRTLRAATRRRSRRSLTGRRIRDVAFRYVQATGFVEHLKLPHYVDFQSELGLLRKLRREFEAADASPADAGGRRMNAPAYNSPISTNKQSG